MFARAGYRRWICIEFKKNAGINFIFFFFFWIDQSIFWNWTISILVNFAINLINLLDYMHNQFKKKKKHEAIIAILFPKYRKYLSINLNPSKTETSKISIVE